jgi:hypothetical protein
MSANPSDVILGSVVVITGTTIIRNAYEKKPKGTTFKPLAFGFMLTVALLAIAIGAPGFAKGLAYLGLVGAFVVNGPAVFALLGKLGS